MSPHPVARHRRVIAATASGLLAWASLQACSSGGGTPVAGAAPTTVAPGDATTGPGTPADAATTGAGGAGTSTTATTGAPATTVPVLSPPSAGITRIEVPSTTSQYFVLYVKPVLGEATEVPVAIARGVAGTTVLTDGRSQLPAEHYRVATFPVDDPGDVDADGIDDLAELADAANANPLNPAPLLARHVGAVVVPDVETFAALSYQGDNVARDRYLAGLEFVKFWITGTNSAHPAVYFMNTNTYKAHPEFGRAVGIAAGPGPSPGAMRGDIVYDPDGIAPDGSKGTYRFAFQPNDAYPFADIALAFELLASSMPMLDNNLLYYPFPQSALPLYEKEKALYDAYRVPVLLS